MTIDAVHSVSPAAAVRPSLEQEWPAIRALWRVVPAGMFATVSSDGSPQITPIGSVYLDPVEPKGYYHPIFTSRLRRNLGEDGRFELLLLDLRARTWLPVLLRGRFDSLVAVRLRGRAVGPRRAATSDEVERWQRRVHSVRWSRAYNLLWKDARYVQELAFDGHVPVRFGAVAHGERAL